ncbi:MAG: ferrous iron transport protein B [Methanocorpusculum sp.]|nr:ferrous iron transport protein B [Methanocorpusculum sp.]
MNITVALAGNPNCGKTTLFNNLTGMRHHVGNWPGKTVTIDRKEGKTSFEGHTFEIIDLPGTYSLSGRSLEEKIADDFIKNETPDVIVNIIDAVHLERNLYLTLQLIEVGRPIIIALNMNKYAEAEGFVIDEKKLSAMLGVRVIKIEAIDETGKKDLLKAVINCKEKPQKYPTYGAELESHLTELTYSGLTRREAVLALLNKADDEPEKITSTRKHLESIFGSNIDEIFADNRYAYIAGVLNEAVHTMSAGGKNQSGRIDKIITNKWLGFPIFLGIMYLIFQAVFTLGAPLMEGIDFIFGQLGEICSTGLTTVSAPEWMTSFVVDGVIGGMGSVIIFLPNIILMFLMLAILEQSGYMARVAVLMDSIMHKLGLHGKSFIPMILGFGCGVPAIMGARAMENRRERNLTILLTPFMSCSARLPVYLLLVGIFFAPEIQGLVMFSLYLLGVAVALITGFLLRKTLFRGEESAFVIEMPPYRLPTIKGVVLHMWDNAVEFLKRAGVIIFPAVLVIWLLATLPLGVEYGSSESIIGIIGSAIAPIFAPLGFGFAEAGVSLVMGLLAKEVVVGSLATLYGVAEDGLAGVLTGVFTPLSAYSFMVFVLLYIPCFAALLTIKKETRSWKFTAGAALFYCVTAWIVSFIIFQGGTLLGF